MNKQLHRVIFSKHLQRLVVVSEKTRSQGKSGAQGGSEPNAGLGVSQVISQNHVGANTYYGKWATLCGAVLIGLGLANLSYANTNNNPPTTIITDPTALKSEQATILTTASGLTQVNIQTPSGAGVSKNTFSQFDVGNASAILNNSRTNTNTQLAGFVQANPWLATGEAKVILNQVNSVNPSYLGGYIEIAGKKADIIIANPSGLQINGAGFINAENVNLVAGTSVMQNGQLSAYKVDTGTIDVQGKLNTKDTNYTALIAKAIQINDEVYAGNQLDVITGENTIPLKEGQLTNLDPVNRRATTQTNQATNEGVALDISSLGGMYAGKIRLVGTDKGFGVTNAGIIQATGHGGAGTLSLDSQGNLSNAGSIFAKDKVAINAHHNDIQNAGNITSKQDDIIINGNKLGNTGAIQGTQTTAITTANTIDNAGIIQSGVLQLQSKELDNTGSIAQTGLGKLAITTKTLNNQNQAIIGQSLYTTNNDAAGNNTGTTATPNTVGNSQTGVNVATAPNQTNTNTNTQVVSTPTANGFINAANIIDNTGNKAQIQANGDIDITTDSVNNADKSSIDVTALSTQSVGNTDSKIALDNINWQLTSFDNSKGDIVARDKMVIASQSSIINTEGRLVADSMVLDAKSELDNSDGVVQSTGDVSVAASKVTNNQGIIHGAHALMINANGILTNNAGVISSSQNTTMTAKTAIDNTDGRIQSDGKLNVNAQQLNSTGTIYGAKGTAITASHVNNEQTGLIASANDVSINTQNLTSAGTISAGMQSDGKLGNTPANISIQATEGIHSSGNAIATGTLTLNANTINLDDSDNQADNITLLAQDTISTRKTSTVASNSLAITAPNKLDNSEGILSANEMIVNTDVLENRQGTISQAGKTALSLAIKRSIDNTLGTISTNSDKLEIETNQLINQQGAIHHAGVGELNVKSENLNNNQGELLSLGTQTLNINKIINNSQGVISATSFAINADGLDNTAGLLQATDKDADNLLNIDSTLDNNKLAEQQGSIDVAGNLTLAAKTLQNQGAITTNNLKATVANVNNTGAIGARGNIQIASSQDIDNTGNISATGNIVLNANNTISHQGVMMAADSITATANRLNFNQSTSSADNISLSAQADIHHNQATTVANNKLSLKNTSAIYNQDGVLSANYTSIGTKDLQNGGIIQADVLTIKQQADYTHTDNDKLLANNLQFSTDGKIINQSQLIANQDLTLSANHIDNTQTGTIKSGNHTQITSQTSINNQGLINGETTVIKANDTINNQSGGRIYGTHLAIQADTLNNTPAKVKESDSKYTAPVIAARERLDIGVKTLNNNPNPDRAGKFNENFDNQALITSLGSLHIGGNLDGSHYATGKADAVINKGATIESDGEMQINTSVLKNENADFNYDSLVKISESAKTAYIPEGDSTHYDPSEVSFGRWGYRLRFDDLLIHPDGESIKYIKNTFNEVLRRDIVTTSDPAKISAGTGLALLGDVHFNKNSTIIVGGELLTHDQIVNLGSMTNEATKGTEKLVKEQNYHQDFGVGRGWYSGRRRNERKTSDPYQIADQTISEASIDLPILNATINTTPVSTQRTLDALSSNDNQALLDALKANQANLSATAQAQLTALLSAKQSGQAVDEAVLANLVDELKHSIANNQAVVVTATDNTISLPNSSLYTINADNPNLPVVQTDPAFTNYKQWLSSDYMLKAIQSDPNHIHKRLSDGYGEQARIKDQYQLLTGRHINTDYRNQEEAYQALMDNGITHAKQFNYTLGMALTAEQMANLTSDIVWLVKESVTYTIKDKEGNLITKTEEVLVPKLYLRSATTDTATLTKDGRLSTISGKNMDIRLTGNLDNNGNFIAKDTISITADNATNKGVIKGNYVAIETQNNIVNHNQIHADSAARLIAGNDIINESLTATKQSVVGRSHAKNTAISQIATISVGKGLQGITDDNGKPLTTLGIQAGNHVLFKAGASHNAGDGTTQIIATNGIKLDTVTQTNQFHAVRDDNNYFKYDSSKELGSSVTGVGNVVLLTTGENADIDITASQVGSQGVLSVTTTGEGSSINIKEGRESKEMQSASQYQDKKWYGKKTINETHHTKSDTALKSTLGGKEVYVASNSGNVTLTGTDINAQDTASIVAKKGAVTIQSAVNKDYQNTTKTTQNFYKQTGSVSGSYQETLAQTTIDAKDVDIQGGSTHVNAANIKATNSIMVGNATLATNPDGTLKQDENGKPIVLSGDIKNLNFGTVALTDETWQENSKEYRGIAKVGMQAVGVVAGALNIGNGVTIAKSNKEHTTSQEEKASHLQANTISVGAQKVTAYGTTFDTDKSGSTTILGEDVLLGTAKHSTQTTSTNARQTVTGEGIKLNKDHLQLGAVVLTDTKDTKITQTDTYKGVTIDSQNTLVLADMNSGTLVTQGANFNAEGADSSLVLGSSNTVLDGITGRQTTTQNNQTDTTRISASVHHVAADTAVAAENLKDATEALKEAHAALKDAKRQVANGTLAADAIKDYELNLAMATANVANAQIALGSAAATAASTAPTLGFSAKVGASHTTSEHQTTQSQESFTGTQINAANVTFVGDSLTAKGLQAQIGNLNVDNLNTIKLTHGTTTDTDSSKGDSKTVNASYGTSGSFSAGASVQTNQASSTSTKAHDSKLTVGGFNGNANTTILEGAHITAYGGDYHTDTLNITTTQNTKTHESNSKGGNIGVGTGSLSLGYNKQNSQGTITTNNAPSGITYVNADASHGSSHSLVANTTTLTGGVIIAVNQDKEGNVTNSNINFTTNTLTTNDLVAKEHSQTRGINASVGIATKGDDTKLSSVGLGLTKEGYEKETKALATISKGATVTGTITHNGQEETTTDLTQTDINTDALNTQQVTKDQKTGGLNFNTTVDTRVFSKEGREGIRKEQEKLDENLKATGKITEAAGVQVVATTANILTGNQTLTEAIQSAKAPGKMAKAIQDNPQLAAILDAYQKGEYHNLTLSQKALQDLSDATDISTEVLLTSITAQRGKRGATNKTLTVIDTHDELRQDSIQTLGHELDHIRGGKNETLADLAGFAAKLNTDAAIIANQDKINPIKAQLGSGKDAQTSLQNQALLNQNNHTFTENHDGREEEWDYAIGHSRYEYRRSDSGNYIQKENGEFVLVETGLGQYEKVQTGEFYTEEDHLYNMHQYLVHDAYKKYLLKNNLSADNLSAEDKEKIILYLMDVLNVPDSVFSVYSGSNYYVTKSNNEENKTIVSAEFKNQSGDDYKNRFILEIVDNKVLLPDEYEELYRNAYLYNRLNNGMNYEKFKSDIKETVQNTAEKYVIPAVQIIGGGAQIVTAAGVEVVGCGASYGTLCIPITALAALLASNGSDDVATGFYNMGKKPEEQTTSFTLTQIYGLSEADANTVKLLVGSASVGGELGVAVNASKAVSSTANLAKIKTAEEEKFIVINIKDVENSFQDLESVGVAYKQMPATPTPNNTHTGTLLMSKECSFHGSMQVKTLFGYKPISSIRINDWVFSKNEITGKTNYRQVLQTINSIDPDTTRITIVNSDGVKQTIISDGLHPYFVDFTGDMTPPKPSTGHSYKGNLTHAYWVGAKDIEIGHRLIDDKGNYQTVIAIHTEATPLNSYNLEVDTDHTFFIKGVDGVESVWVHNKNCFIAIGENPMTKVINGKTVTYSDYVIGMDSNKQPITKRIPTISEDGKIVEVKVESGKVSIVNENKPDVNYTQTNGKLVSRTEDGAFATNEHKPPQPDVERIIPDNLETNKEERLFNNITLHESLPDPVAGWDYKPHLLEKGNNGTDANIYSQVNGYLGEIELANRLVNEGYIVLKWGDKIGRNGSDIISIDQKTNTVVLWDNKYRSNGGTLELSPTFNKYAKTETGNPSNAWANAKNEAIEAIQKSNIPNDLKVKLIADVDNGNFETRTVGSGALEGQEVIQKYQNNRKLIKVVNIDSGE